jgi:Mlc titration factor MtfA (ptsG expression regulator)
LTIFIIIIITAVTAWCLFQWSQRRRRGKLFRKPLPPDWLRILERNVPLYARLPVDLRPVLHGCIQLFLDEKEFFGCAGLAVTDEMRLTIAGNASLLLLKRDDPRFTGFTSILVYPETYVAREIQYDGPVEVHGQSARAGESWHRGPVILSWGDILRGIREDHDGHNVVLHEFAHKLDEENEIMDGLPILRHSADYREWTEVLRKEYDALQKRLDNGGNPVLDSYATVSPAEFFAVATESFFEKPGPMKEKLPELYEQFKRFYDLDPAIWYE